MWRDNLDSRLLYFVILFLGLNEVKLYLILINRIISRYVRVKCTNFHCKWWHRDAIIHFSCNLRQLTFKSFLVPELTWMTRKNAHSLAYHFIFRCLFWVDLFDSLTGRFWCSHTRHTKSTNWYWYCSNSIN